MTVKVGINGFGRIGRNIFRQALNNEQVEVVAINDLTDADMLAHLLKYDSVHGKLEADVKTDGEDIVVNDKKIHVSSERDPANIDWKSHGVEVVIESTGIFTNRDAAQKHIDAGAKKVVISAPDSNEYLTLVLRVNDDKYDESIHQVMSNAFHILICIAP